MCLKGGGLVGNGLLLPESDVRGIRIGIAARQLILQLPSVESMPLSYESYDAWHHIQRPLPNAMSKVIQRLREAGLIWSVRRWVSYGSNDWTQCLALTPLGTDVVAVFSDYMRRGQRIRWNKWDRPSVQCTDELCRDTLQAMKLEVATKDDSEIIFMETTPTESIPCSYGTSRNYLLRRLAREDSLWGDVLLWPQVIGGWHVSDYLTSA